MLCQNCGKYEATTHIKRIVNGEATEAHLCSDCARALGYDSVFPDARRWGSAQRASVPHCFMMW